MMILLNTTTKSTLVFDSGDPDGKDLYRQMYLRRQAIRHLLMNIIGLKVCGKRFAVISV